MTTDREHLESAIKLLKQKRAAAKRQQRAAQERGKAELVLQLQERIQDINQYIGELKGLLVYTKLVTPKRPPHPCRNYFGEPGLWVFKRMETSGGYKC